MKKIKLSALLYSTAIFFSFAVFATSCSDDDDDNNKLLITEVKGDNYKTNYEYDGQNRLVKKVSVDSEDGTTSTKTIIYAYGADGKFIKAVSTSTSGDTSRTDITYNKDSVFVAETSRSGDDEYVYTDTLIVNPAGQIVKKLRKTNVTTFEYDGSGNMKKETKVYTNFNGIDDVYVRDYTYDNKNGVLSQVNMPFWAMYIMKVGEDVAKNNLLSEDYTNNGKLSEKYSYTYKYNKDGYPEACTLIETDVKVSETSTATHTFSYKKAN